MAKSDPSEFPEELLDKINTHTYGGYLLFWFDSRGEPRTDMRFNEPVDSIALKKFALDVLRAMDFSSRQSLALEIADMQREPDSLGEEDEEV